MGIKDLFPLLKDHTTHGESDISISELEVETRVVAIDGNLLAFSYFSYALKMCLEKMDHDDLVEKCPDTIFNRGGEGEKELCDNYIKVRTGVQLRVEELIRFFNENGLDTIFVFDGKEPIPEKKEKAHVSRAKARDTGKKKVEGLKSELKEIEILERDEKRKRDLVKSYIESGLVRPKEDLSHFINICKELNQRVIIAEDEGERECARLCQRGEAGCVLTTDSDCLTFGAPVLIRSVNVYNGKIKVAYLRKILDDLEINYHQFVDMCIMLGCDFNDRVKGFGPKNIMKKVKEVTKEDKECRRIIEKIFETLPKYDKGCLNAERCREIFLK